MNMNVEKRFFEILEITDVVRYDSGILKATLIGYCEDVKETFSNCLYYPVENLWLALEDNLWLDTYVEPDFEVEDGAFLFFPKRIEKQEEKPDKLYFFTETEKYEVIGIFGSVLLVVNDKKEFYFVEATEYLMKVSKLIPFIFYAN